MEVEKCIATPCFYGLLTVGVKVKHIYDFGAIRQLIRHREQNEVVRLNFGRFGLYHLQSAMGCVHAREWHGPHWRRHWRSK